MGTSSAEIAAELRAQIFAGELRRGEMLPSAREITRRWNVAIATASRVHALLRSEGLATPISGVGTIVATTAPDLDGNSRLPQRSRQRQHSHSLATEPDDAVAQRIITAAVSIADVEGINPLSMRRVAHAVHMSSTTLYRFYPSRDHLLSVMMDRALRDWSAGDQLGTWREDLIRGHRELWRTFRRHPWLASQLSVTRPQLVPSGLVFTEWAIRTLTRAGIGIEEALETHILLFTQARGMAILLEPEAEAESITGVDADAWIDERLDKLQELSSVENLAAIRSLIGSGYVLDLDRAYGRGLELTVDGIASRLARLR